MPSSLIDVLRDHSEWTTLLTPAREQLPQHADLFTAAFVHTAADASALFGLIAGGCFDGASWKEKIASDCSFAFLRGNIGQFASMDRLELIKLLKDESSVPRFTSS